MTPKNPVNYFRSISAISTKSAETPVKKDFVLVDHSKDDDDDLDDGEYDPKVSGPEWKLLFRAMKLNAPEWYLIVLGVISAAISGLVFPGFAIIFILLVNEFSSLYVEGIKNNCTYPYGILSLCQSPFEINIPADCLPDTGDDGLFIGVIVMFSGLGLVTGFLILVRSVVFSVSAERLTKRIRELTFKSMIKQDVKFFDNPKRSVGRLLIRLSTDSGQVS